MLLRLCKIPARLGDKIVRVESVVVATARLGTGLLHQLDESSPGLW